MQQSGDRRGTTTVTARRRWTSALLSILIAFSVILHLGQPASAHAAMGTMVVAAASHNGAPCESSHHPTTGHCAMVTACSLYAPLEASPASFVADKSHVLPAAEAFEASWAVTPQLQPPQLSLQF
jgi:hypothetical protein